MVREACALLILLGGALACAAEEPASQPGSGLHPEYERLLRRLDKAYDRIDRISGEMLGDLGLPGKPQTGPGDKWREEIVAACARITVTPQVEEAAALMRQGDFAPALRMLEAAQAQTPDDPYAAYLAGMCTAELGQYAAGAEHFARVLKSEPKSHTARLLSELCTCAASRPTPLSDEDILECFDAGMAAAKPPTPDLPDTDDITVMLKRMFGCPELLKDPLLYKLDNEALAGRRPHALSMDRLIEAALASDDTYELFLGWQFATDDETHATFAERLGAPKHAAITEALLFLIEYFGEDALYKQRGAAFERQVAELRKLMPTEGLWMMLSIPYEDPSDEDAKCTPLAESELELLEQAGRAERFTTYGNELTDAALRLFRRLRYPYAIQASDHLSRTVPSAFRALRSIAQRAEVLARQKLQDGDVADGLRVVRAVLAYADRLEPRPDGLNAHVMLIRSAYRASWGSVVAESLPSTYTDEWLAHQQLRATARAEYEPLSELYADCRVGDILPVTRINSAFHRIFDGKWPPWKLRRAQRIAQDADTLKSERDWLEWYWQNGHTPYVNRFLDIGILQRRSLLPEVRRFRDRPTEDDRLWAIVWVLGELQDTQSIDWLIAQLGDDRLWLRRAAAEALEKITGRHLGNDQDAWLKVYPAPPKP